MDTKKRPKSLRKPYMEIRGTSEMSVLLVLLNAKKAVNFWRILDAINEESEGEMTDGALSKRLNRLAKKKLIERFKIPKNITGPTKHKYNYRLSDKGHLLVLDNFEILENLKNKKL